MARPALDRGASSDHAAWVRRITSLDELECRDLLRHCSIGRVAVVVGHLAHIFPVNYAVDDDDEIIFRSGPGTKLDAAVTGSTVTFEIDEADPIDHSGWSVVVSGVTRLVSDPEERLRMARLPLHPWAADDGEWIRLRPLTYSGRRVGPTA
jgi:nitroimidazol reductase NimA-like FMN-containing flavoprotein (pyridoxamine 5'-phosphate oxidase superfamily)